jgi:uncharacterized protein (TIGR02001 family)
MKKTIAFVGALLAGLSLNAQDVSVSTTVGWESEYIFRGEKLGEDIQTAAIDVSYLGGYVGLWSAFPAKGTSSTKAVGENEIDLYAGYNQGIGEVIKVDVGLTYYMYPAVADNFRDAGQNANTLEFYAGVSADLLLKPSLYVYLDRFAKDGTYTIEASVGHTFDITQMMAFDVGAHVGFVQPNSSAYDKYNYYGVTTDFKVKINPNTAFSIGARYVGSTEYTLGALGATDKRNEFYMGSSLSIGF